MEPATAAAIADCCYGSHEGRLAFPQVLAGLAAAGVERYHADLCRNQTTYYLPSGEALAIATRLAAAAPADAFAPAAVVAAIRAAQAGEIRYPAFCERIVRAGCVGYLVSLPGRRVVYYGRTAEVHVEHFPAAAP